jgi:hypothetical protein
MSLFSRSMPRGLLAGLVVLIGAANGPAHASHGINALTLNALLANGGATSGLDDLNGVTIEAVTVPGDAVR